MSKLNLIELTESAGRWLFTAADLHVSLLSTGAFISAPFCKKKINFIENIRVEIPPSVVMQMAPTNAIPVRDE